MSIDLNRIKIYEMFLFPIVCIFFSIKYVSLLLIVDCIVELGVGVVYIFSMLVHQKRIKISICKKTKIFGGYNSVG